MFSPTPSLTPISTSASSWHVHLILNREEYVPGSDELPQASWRGFIREEERLIQAFDARWAPPGAQLLAIRLHSAVGSDGSSSAIDLFATGEPLEIPVPVTIHHARERFDVIPLQSSHQDKLRESAILLLGQGSLGSTMTLHLGRAGVGMLTLADPDQVSVTNAMCRHEASLADCGRAKCSVMAERLIAINPSIQVETYVEDIFLRPDDEVNAIVRRHDLVVATTDQRHIQILASQAALRVGRPALFAGVYARAVGGEVFWHLPRAETEFPDPCYACLRGSRGVPDPSNRRPYLDEKEEGGFHAEPGMHAGIAQVAVAAVQIAVGVLLRNEAASDLGHLARSHRYLRIGAALAASHVLFGRPFRHYVQPIAGPRSGCTVCNPPWSLNPG